MLQEENSHALTLQERNKLTMRGVSEVVSFEENLVQLRTSLGDLAVHGQQLQLKNLTLEGGEVAVEGHISALIYQEPQSGGWLSRLFG